MSSNKITADALISAAKADLSKVSPLTAVMLVGIVTVVLAKNIYDFFTTSNDPFGGLSQWEPKWWARMRFWLGAQGMIHNGYEKVRCLFSLSQRNL
jgi:hypothetical protein